MRRVTTILAIALFLLGCSSVAAPTDEPMPAPAGKAIDVARYGDGVGMRCRDAVEGPLQADVEVEQYVGGYSGIVVEVSPNEAGVWPEPSGVDPWPVPLVPVHWPMDYTGVRLANGEVAVVNGAGHLVATTATSYRLKGDWSILGSVGGPKFPHSWINGFNVCPDSGSVEPT